jgi:hypothetical protein
MVVVERRGNTIYVGHADTTPFQGALASVKSIINK